MVVFDAVFLEMVVVGTLACKVLEAVTALVHLVWADGVELTKLEVAHDSSA